MKLSTRVLFAALMLLTAELILQPAIADTGNEVGRLIITVSGKVINNTKCTLTSMTNRVDFGEVTFSNHKGTPDHPSGGVSIDSKPFIPVTSLVCTGPIVTAKMYLDGETVNVGRDIVLKTDNEDLGIQLWVNDVKQNAGAASKFLFNTGGQLRLSAQLIQINPLGEHLQDGPFSASATLHVDWP